MRTIALAVLLPLGCLHCRAGLEDYAVEVVSQRDSMTFVMADEKLAVTVTSATGIGRLEIGLRKEDSEWPGAVVLSIRTKDGKPLRELEGFSLAGQRIRIHGSRRSSGAMDCRDVTPDDPKGPGRHPRKVKVTVERSAKVMRVVIPGALLRGERKVRIQWIDYYR